MNHYNYFRWEKSMSGLWQPALYRVEPRTSRESQMEGLVTQFQKVDSTLSLSEAMELHPAPREENQP